MKEKLSEGKRNLLEYLGDDYTTKDIDYELCVYKDLGDYDIEISGGRRICDPFEIYVWRMKDWTEIVERHFKVRNDLPKVKALLDDIRERYGNGIPGREPDTDSLRIIAEAITGGQTIKPRTFFRWGLETIQAGEIDVLRFVDHMKDDITFPKTTKNKVRLKRYLIAINAGPWAMEAFEHLWDRYEKDELLTN